MMRLTLSRLGRALRAAFVSLMIAVLSAQPAMAQSVLRDAETEALFNDMSEPIIRSAGLSPKNVRILLVGDKSINAFTAGGQDVFMHSGLIVAADNANEVQGVIAHELGHVAGGHVLRQGEGIRAATGITILSLLLGAAAIAAGAGDAGAGILAAGQQAALGKYLAFTRTQESAADAAAQTYLTKSGISGKGMISFFKKLTKLEYRYGVKREDSFAYDHPLSSERISVLQEKFVSDAAWSKDNAALELRFQRVKAKLTGFSTEPKRTLVEFPETNTSIPARYARAYAWHRSAYPDKALAEANALLAVMPRDPYFLELKGQILLESGRPAEALSVLREATNLTNNHPLIASLFGHALIATDDKANSAEAQRVLKAAVNRDNDNPFAWYQLGTVYEREGDLPRAQLATAERYNLEGRSRLALASAEAAMAGIPQGSADWIRAQDIAMVSREAAQREKKRR